MATTGFDEGASELGGLVWAELEPGHRNGPAAAISPHPAIGDDENIGHAVIASDGVQGSQRVAHPKIEGF